MDENTLRVRVLARRKESLQIDSFELGAADAGELPAFDAGAHIDVYLPNGLVRQYSLCNRPDQQDVYRIAVLCDIGGRGGSKAMHETIFPGDVIRIGLPRNAFRLHPGKHHRTLLAGGVGITPLLSMAHALHQRGSPFDLHYFARSRSHAAFVNELRGAPFAGSVEFHFDDERSSRAPAIAQIMGRVAAGTHLYACGPAGLLTRLQELATQHGHRPDHFHFENFSPAPPVRGEAEFEVRLVRSGRSVRVGSNETVVAAVARAGVDIPVSCEQGICGTCLTAVLDGLPDHRDQYLTEAEHRRNDRFTPCCSRASSACLVLDL